MNSYYPIYLNLSGRRCIVIGGDKHAESKACGLLDAGALVTVIARNMTVGLVRLCEEGQIMAVVRDYRPGDLRGAFLVISALVDPSVNRRIWREAEERNVLINAMDDVPHCNFIAPSIVRRGDLTIAISTAGKAPALAVRIRQQLEQAFGPEYARFLDLAGDIRASLSERHPDFETRRAFWYRLIDSDVINLLRQGNEAAALQSIEDILGETPDMAVASLDAEEVCQ